MASTRILSKGSNSFPNTDGLKKHSGAKNLSIPTLITSPSGNIKLFSIPETFFERIISFSGSVAT